VPHHVQAAPWPRPTREKTAVPTTTDVQAVLDSVTPAWDAGDAAAFAAPVTADCTYDTPSCTAGRPSRRFTAGCSTARSGAEVVHGVVHVVDASGGVLAAGDEQAAAERVFVVSYLLVEVTTAGTSAPSRTPRRTPR
jgi:hypothetical protein